MLSLDGYFEGLEHDTSWHNVDDEMQRFALEQLNEADALFFGRRTYELMAGYWPEVIRKEGRHGVTTAEFLEPDLNLEIALRMDAMPKFVFSRTMRSAEWRNTRVISDKVAEEVQDLKELTGRDIAIFGSNNLTVALTEMGLVDEFRIMINPILLGQGTPLMKGIHGKEGLTLTGTRAFSSGNILLRYVPR
jgi:dihydrofolate reductase